MVDEAGEIEPLPRCADCDDGADLLRGERCGSCGRARLTGLCFRCSIGQHDKCDEGSCSHTRAAMHLLCACEQATPSGSNKQAPQ